MVADEQTEGHGRHGRSWISNKNAGLYLSIVLKPKLEKELLPLITLMAAVAVFETLAELYEVTPDIKWSNDVLINNKKISGILAESTETKFGFAVILGIGINLNAGNFSSEPENNATSIKTETGSQPNRDLLIQTLVRYLTYFYAILEAKDGDAEVRKLWRARSSYSSRKHVKATFSNEIVLGETVGIEKNGALRLKLQSGEIIIIQAGDVAAIRENT